MNICHKIKELIYKWMAKDTELITYTRYKLKIIYNNGEEDYRYFRNYSIWKEAEFIEYEVLDNDKGVYINHDTAIPLHRIKQIEVSPIDRQQVPNNILHGVWLTKEEIDECREDMKEILKYLEEDK
nr:MAG TPA: hypothetical protein [Caudoviricetes sp.]